nr:metal-sensitive transcriptional regulator [Clostridium acetobutylicum]
MIIRLRKIEGQVKGIEKMIESDTCCKNVLVQIAAVKAAVNKIGILMLQDYAKKCMKDELKEMGEKELNDSNIDDIISAITMFVK